MPCVKTGCPCWTQAELKAVGVSYTPHLVDEFRDQYPDFSSLALVENREATDSFPYGAFQVAQIDQFAAGTAPVCRYFNADFAPNAPEGIFRVQEVTSAEAGVCRAQSETQVTALQTAGVPITCTGNACPA